MFVLSGVVAYHGSIRQSVLLLLILRSVGEVHPNGPAYSVGKEQLVEMDGIGTRNGDTDLYQLEKNCPGHRSNFTCVQYE